MSCKWLLFLPHHAFCYKATCFNAGLQRGCLPVPHRGLCAVTLRVLTLGRRRGEVGGGGIGGRWWSSGWALAANSVNPLRVLAPSATLFHSHPSSSASSSSSSLFSSLSPSRSPFLHLFGPVTKLILRPTGSDPRTGLSQLAYQELPQRSADIVIEGEQRKQGGKQIFKNKAVPLLEGGRSGG